MLVVPDVLLRHGKFEPHGTLHWFLGNILSFTPPFPKMQDSLTVFKIRTCKGCQLVATEEPLRHGKFELHETLHWFLGNILILTPPFPKMQDSLSVFKIRTCKGCQLVATEELLRHGKFEPNGTLHWFLGNIEKKGHNNPAQPSCEKAGEGLGVSPNLGG